MINSLKLKIRPRRGRAAVLRWAIPVLLAGSPVLSCAEEAMEAERPAVVSDQAPLPAGRDMSSMPEPEIQEYLAEVRTKFVQTRRDLLQLRTGLEEVQGKELVEEAMRLRHEIRLLEEQAEAAPDNADELAAQMRTLRQTLYAKEAERQGLLDQSDEYRALSAREAALREQLRSILQVLQERFPEDNVERTD
jgi:hypothetical protein